MTLGNTVNCYEESWITDWQGRVPSLTGGAYYYDYYDYSNGWTVAIICRAEEEEPLEFLPEGCEGTDSYQAYCWNWDESHGAYGASGSMSGGAGYYNPAPYLGSEADHARADTMPDCNIPQTDPYKRAYCGGKPPTTTERAKIDSALTRMRNRGPTCELLADGIASLLGLNRFRLFEASPQYNFRGATDYEAPWSFIARYYITYGAGPVPGVGRNLDGALAHEMDHYFRSHLNHPPGTVDNQGHLPAVNGVLRTVNEAACSGL